MSESVDKDLHRYFDFILYVIKLSREMENMNTCIHVMDSF